MRRAVQPLKVDPRHRHLATTYRFTDLPDGWWGKETKVDVPYLTNLRLDPFEHTGRLGSEGKYGAQQYFDLFKYDFWRFVFVQRQAEKLALFEVSIVPPN